MASFDRQATAAAKNLVNQISLLSADRLLDAITSFGTVVRQALTTALALTAFVFGTFGAILYLVADSLIEFRFL
jgi:hypothetical protein